MRVERRLDDDREREGEARRLHEIAQLRKLGRPQRRDGRHHDEQPREPTTPPSVERIQPLPDPVERPRLLDGLVALLGQQHRPVPYGAEGVERQFGVSPLGRAQGNRLPLAVEPLDQQEGVLRLAGLDQKGASDLEELPELQPAHHIGHAQRIERVAQRPHAVRQRVAGIRLPDPKQADADPDAGEEQMEQKRHLRCFKLKPLLKSMPKRWCRYPGSHPDNGRRWRR